MKRINVKRAASTFRRGFHSRAFVNLVKLSGWCASCGQPAREDRPLTCSHAETRQRGSWHSDWRRIFRQCMSCHMEYEGNAEEFLADLGFTIADRERWITDLHSEALEAGVITSDELELT